MAAATRPIAAGNTAGSGGACGSPSIGGASTDARRWPSPGAVGQPSRRRRTRGPTEQGRHLRCGAVEHVVGVVQRAGLVEADSGDEQPAPEEAERPGAADPGVVVARGHRQSGVRDDVAVVHRGHLRRRSAAGGADGPQHELGHFDQAPTGDVEGADHPLAVLRQVGLEGRGRGR